MRGAVSEDPVVAKGAGDCLRGYGPQRDCAREFAKAVSDDQQKAIAARRPRERAEKIKANELEGGRRREQFAEGGA